MIDLTLSTNMNKDQTHNYDSWYHYTSWNMKSPLCMFIWITTLCYNVFIDLMSLGHMIRIGKIQVIYENYIPKMQTYWNTINSTLIVTQSNIHYLWIKVISQLIGHSSIGISARMIRRIGKKHYLVSMLQTRRGNGLSFWWYRWFMWLYSLNKLDFLQRL